MSVTLSADTETTSIAGISLYLPESSPDPALRRAHAHYAVHLAIIAGSRAPRRPFQNSLTALLQFDSAKPECVADDRYRTEGHGGAVGT